MSVPGRENNGIANAHTLIRHRIEVIDIDTKESPFRKYLNNVSPEPTKEDEERAKFLAFSQ